MKVIGKRVLATVLSVALLVTCTVSGLVLPAAAEPAEQNTTNNGPVNLLPNGNMETGSPFTVTRAQDAPALSYTTVTGYDGNATNRVLALDFSKAVSKDSDNPTVFLTYTGAPTRANGLEEGKRYLLSFKVKGVACQFWGSNQWSGLTGKNTDIDTSRWYGISAVIGATQEVFNAWRVIDKYNSNGVVYLDDFVLQELGTETNLMPTANGDVWPIVTMDNQMFRHNYFETHSGIGEENLSIKTESGNRYYEIKPTANIGDAFPHIGMWGENLLTQKGIYKVTYRFRVRDEGTETVVANEVLDMNPDANHSVVLEKYYTPADADGWRTAVVWFALGAKKPAVSDVNGESTFYGFQNGAGNWILRTFFKSAYDYDLDDLTLQLAGTAAEYSAANADQTAPQTIRIAGENTLVFPAQTGKLLSLEGSLDNGTTWNSAVYPGTLNPSPVVLESNEWATVTYDGQDVTSVTRIAENEERDPNLYTSRPWITASGAATWSSSNTAVATVDEKSGFVTMVSCNPNDSATITATATINGVQKTAQVVVKPEEVTPTAVALDKTTAEVQTGETVTLALSATAPANAWVDPAKIVWTTSDQTVATVANGVVTAVYQGESAVETATITAAYGGRTASCVVTVLGRATALAISPSSVTLAPTLSKTLTATAYPAGSAVGEITWNSSNQAVATVDSTGKVTAVAVGTATITASCWGTVQDSCEVTVDDYATVLLDGDFESATASSSWTTNYASIIPEPGNESNHVYAFGPNVNAKEFWVSADSYKLSYNTTAGVLYRLSGRFKGSDKPGVNLRADYVEKIGGTAAGWQYPEGSANEWRTFSYIVRIKPDAANKLFFGFVNAGTGSVCYFDDIKLEKVVPPALTGITVLPETMSYGVGFSKQLTVKEIPDDALLGTLTWQSNATSVAEVDQNGRLTTKAAGTATITVTSSYGFSDSCTVSVVNEATSFAFSKDAYALVPGAVQTLHLTATPVGATPTGTLQWSSSVPAVATVANGVVTALTQGTTIITVTNGVVSDTCEITVSAQGNLIVGGDFEDTTLPDNWDSVIAGDKAAAGTDNANDANRVLQVKAAQTTGYYDTGLTMANNTYYRFTADVKGFAATLDFAGTSKGIVEGGKKYVSTTNLEEWTQISFVFRTAATGTIAAQDGLFRFIAHTDGDTYYDNISLVQLPALTGISIPETESVAPNNYFTMSVTPTPANAHLAGITWSSSDESIATVDSTGKVTGIKEGTVTITAQIDGTSIVKTTQLTVDNYAPLLRNGDFEELDKNWSTLSHAGHFVEGAGENGGNAFVFTEDRCEASYLPSIYLIPWNTYKLTARYKTNGNISDAARVYGRGMGSLYFKATNGQWATTEITFRVPATWEPVRYGRDLSLLTTELMATEGYQITVDSIDLRMYDTGISAEKVTLAPGNTTLLPGESKKLAVIFTPAKANSNFMTWSSGNENVVTMRNGIVTAVGGGTATVTVTTADGKTASSTVTVAGDAAHLKNGTYDITTDNSWVLTAGATITAGEGVDGTNALAIAAGATATQAITGLKPNTTYKFVTKFRPVNSGKGKVSLIKEGVAEPLVVANIPVTTQNWAEGEVFYTTPAGFDCTNVSVKFENGAATGTAYFDNAMLIEGVSDVDLIVPDFTWNNGETQFTPGTPVNFTVRLANIGEEDTQAGQPITVQIRANGNTVYTLYYNDVLAAGDEVTLYSDTAAPWLATEGDITLAAIANPDMTFLEKNRFNNGVQYNIRVSDTFLEAPQVALNENMDTLVFSDDFDTLDSIDQTSSGQYGYKWYTVTGDRTSYSTPDDYELTQDGVRLKARKTDSGVKYLYGVDMITGAGWEGFLHGYVEIRMRFGPDSAAEGDYKGPTFWALPTQRLFQASNIRFVELDFMEYYGDAYDRTTYGFRWTVTLHDQTTDQQGSVIHWERNSNSAITQSNRGLQNDIGDNEWHVLGYVWNEGKLRAYMDGREVFSLDWTEDQGATPPAVLNKGEATNDVFTALDLMPQTMIMSGSEEWPMEVDYIRIWQNPEFFDLSDTELYLAPGTSRTLSATATPKGPDSDEVTWSSSDTGVVTVNASTGKVTAIAAGTATVTATSTENSEFTAVCTVTVDAYGERLVSGDFEADTGAVQWTGDIIKDGVGTVIPEPGNEKNHVLALPANKGGYYGGLNVTVGEIYELTGRVKGADKPSIYLNSNNFVTFPVAGSPAWIYPGTSDTEWSNFRCIFKVQPKAGVTLNTNQILYLGNSGSGIAYFDDIHLSKRITPVLKSITVTPSTGILSVGRTLQLTASPNPNEFDVVLGQLTWESSNSSVATVDQTGKVTGIAMGTATITVTSDNGLQQTAQIVVSPEPTAVAMDETTVSLFGKGTTKQLSVVATAPVNACADPKKVTWMSSNTSVATVDANGLVTATYAGEDDKTATITAVYEGIETPATAVVTVNNNLVPENIFAAITTDDTQDVYMDADGGYNGKNALVLKVPAQTGTDTRKAVTFNLKTPAKEGHVYLVRAKFKGSAVGAYSAPMNWLKLDDKLATAGGAWTEIQGTMTPTADISALTITFYNQCRFTGYGFTGDDETNPSVDVDAYISDVQIFDLQVCDEVNILAGEGGALWGSTQTQFGGTDDMVVVDGEPVMKVDAFTGNKHWTGLPEVLDKVYVMKYKYKPVDAAVGGTFYQTETGVAWTANAYKMGDAVSPADEDGWVEYVTYSTLGPRNPNTYYLYYARNTLGSVYVKDLVCNLVDKDDASIGGADYVFTAGWTTPYLSATRFIQASSSTGYTWEIADTDILRPSNAAATTANFWVGPRGIGSTAVTVTNNETGDKASFNVVVNSALRADGTQQVQIDTPHANTAVKNPTGEHVDTISTSTIMVEVVPHEGYLPVPDSMCLVLADGTKQKMLNRDGTVEPNQAGGYEFVVTVPSQDFTITAEMAPTQQNGYQIATVATGVHRTAGEVDGVRFLTRMYVENLNLNSSVLTLKQDGTTKAVVSMGVLLKRASNKKALKLENVGGTGSANKVWQWESYASNKNRLNVLDYTNSYIDFAAVMMTRVPSNEFKKREYVSCGYIKFADGTVIYTTPMVDSAAAAIGRGA